MNFFKYFVLSIMAVALLMPVQMSMAKGNLDSALSGLKTTGDIAVGVETTQSSLSDIIGGVIKTALGLVGTIFLVLIIYGGFLWMTARGEEEQVKKAQKIVVQTVIGLVLVLSAYAITLLVTGQVGAL